LLLLLPPLDPPSDEDPFSPDEDDPLAAEMNFGFSNFPKIGLFVFSLLSLDGGPE
jgi:hypothetical protein